MVPDARFRSMVAELRALAPPPRGLSVEVQRCDMDDLGDTSRVGRKIVVSVRSDMTENETIDTLIHEWAHVLSWRPYSVWHTDHDEHWGIEYAKIYRAYHGTR